MPEADPALPSVNPAPAGQARRWRDQRQPPAHNARTEPGEQEDPAALLKQGVFGLRFTPALEAAFQQDNLAARRTLMLVCGFIGMVSVLAGSTHLAELIPDAPTLAMRNLTLILSVSIACFACALLVPPVVARHWLYDLMTTLPLVTINATVIVHCRASTADTAFSHSAALVSTLVYACIVARLRFRWSAACALVSFLAYATLAPGHTPSQAQIQSSTLSLMALSYVFVLATNYSLEYAERRNWLMRQVDTRQRAQLHEVAQHLKRLSTIDPLTQLFNRRQFIAELDTAWMRAANADEALTMLMVDIDFFKRYNDHLGHPAGDSCLAEVARVIAQVSDEHGGVASRLGGEEFAVLLPATHGAAASLAGERLCEQVRRRQLPHEKSPFGLVTVSVGVASVCPKANLGAQSLVDLADQALYLAKQSGRDRACMDASADREASAHVDGTLPTAANANAASMPAIACRTPQARWAPWLGPWPKLGLKFATEAEQAYKASHAEARRQLLPWLSMLGLVLLDVFLWLNQSSWREVRGPLVTALPWINLGIVLVTATMVLWRQHVQRMEWAFSLVTTALCCGLAWLLGQGQSNAALAYSVSLVLLPMFSAAGARQPVRYTIAPALATCLTIAACFTPIGPQQVLIYRDSLTMIATNCLFTLIMAYTLEQGQRRAWLLAESERQQAQVLASTTQELQALSMRDPLTGIGNRRQFDADLQSAWTHGAATTQPLAMLVIDVDHFKLYNDRHGHPAGDACLQRVASAIAHTVNRLGCRAARLGGEEFGVLLPGKDAAAALGAAELVVNAVRQLAIPHPSTQVKDAAHVTVSVGVATVRPDTRGQPRMLFELADQALYLAKTSGRDRAAPATRSGPNLATTNHGAQAEHAQEHG
jgi:diguanylate cyclase (GGDEF)-like protein